MAKKTWHDQHLKTCACKKCALKPKKSPDKPIVSPSPSKKTATYTTSFTGFSTPGGVVYFLSPGSYVMIDGQQVMATGGKVTVTTTAPGNPRPKTKLLDSSNPFAKALDAWRGGQANWIKGALYQPEGDDNPFDNSYI